MRTLTRRQRMIGLKRLAILAQFLPKVPPERFDMGNWSKGVGFCGLSDEPIHLRCSTSACACGWATTIPVLRRAGLSLRPYSIGGIARGTLCFGEYTEYDAASRFFHLTAVDTEYLFAPSESHNTPAEKAVQIQEYIVAVIAGKTKL